MADPAAGGAPVATVRIGQFADPLPPAVTIRSVTITWLIGNGRIFSYMGTPTIYLSLNGTQIGQSYLVQNVSQCTPTTAQTYTFATGDNPNGFPGYVSGGANNITMTIAGGTIYPSDYARVTLTYDATQTYDFNVTDQAPEPERRILISNQRLAYPYPHFQSIGAQDAAVLMSVRARDGQGNLRTGVPLYLRVLDPPDPAPYMNLPTNTLAHDADNVGPKPKIDGNGITADPATPGIYHGTTGANGIVEFTLRLQPGTAAGDNYRVEVSDNPAFGASSKSGALTAWKRMFVEKRRMLRNSIFLTARANAGAASVRIKGNRYGGNQGRGRVSRGDRIVLVHSPDLTRNNALGGTYMEEHTVLDVQQAAGSTDFIVSFGTRQGKTTTPEFLIHDYLPDSIDPSVGDALAALNGQTLTTADYFDAPDDLVLHSVFPESFVEYIMLDSISVAGLNVPIPRIPSDRQPLLQHLVDRWSGSVSWDGTASRAAANTQLLVIADSDGVVPPGAPGAGLTLSLVTGETSSWVFRGTLDDTAGNRSMDPNAWAMKTAAHEITHQWRANGIWNHLDHCASTTKTYNDGTLYCLMAENSSTGAETQRANGVARFHLLPNPAGGWHSEYFEIRRAADPFVP